MKTKLVALVLLVSLAMVIAALTAKANEEYRLVIPAVSAYPAPDAAYPEPTYIPSPNPVVPTLIAKRPPSDIRPIITPSYRP